MTKSYFYHEGHEGHEAPPRGVVIRISQEDSSTKQGGKL